MGETRFTQLVLLLLSFSVVTFGQQKKEEDAIPNVKFGVISQRWLTNEERGASITLNIAVRVRLSNESKKDVHFTVFDDGDIYPLGFQYSRNVGEKEWKRLSPDNSFMGEGYRDLILSPGMSIECDLASMSLNNVERKFSVLLSLEKGGSRFEVFSDIYRPITKT